MAVDQTVKIFDQFYNLELFINANDYEIVESFFKQYTSNKAIASTYAETLFKISTLTDIPVQTLLENFQGLDSMRVTLMMAYYLNSLGTKTLMYGINNVPIPVNPVARNVVQ